MMPPAVLPDPSLNSLLLWDIECWFFLAFFGLGMLWNEVDFVERAKRLAIICWHAGFKVGMAIVPRGRNDWWRFRRRKK